MAEYIIQDTTLSAIADVIRDKFYNEDLSITLITDAKYDITDFNIPEDITSIGAGLFYNCTKLVLTSLPEGITSIDINAFSGCTNLALTSLPESINIINVALFQNCTKLSLTSLPEGITTINGNAIQ